MIEGLALLLAGIALAVLGFAPHQGGGARYPIPSIIAGVLGVIVAVLGVLVLAGLGTYA